MTAATHPELLDWLRKLVWHTSTARAKRRYAKRKKMHAAGQLRCSHGIPCNHGQAG